MIVFKVDHQAHGTWGTTLTGALPANLRAWGNLTEVDMRLQRTYGFEGKKRSFLSAGCAAPKGTSQALFRLAKTTFTFAAAPTATSTLSETCKAKG